jgi:hypothetical protein
MFINKQRKKGAGIGLEYRIEFPTNPYELNPVQYNASHTMAVVNIVTKSGGKSCVLQQA